MNIKSKKRPHGKPGTLLLALGIVISILFFTGIKGHAKVYLNVGILGDPKNYNPFGATDAPTKKLLSLIYQPLYLVDQNNQKLIPWLAEDQPKYDPDTHTVIIRLREMQWDNGVEFTADDVVFTAEIHKKFQIPRYYDYWKFVKRIEALDKRTVRMVLDRPMAIFYTRTLTSWIVQKQAWNPVVEKANALLEERREKAKAQGKTQKAARESGLEVAKRLIQTHSVSVPIGLGPFSFVEEMKEGYILFKKNSQFFGQGFTIGGKKLGPEIDRIIFKIYASTAVATLALSKGDIDFLWESVSQSLVEDMADDPNISLLMSLARGYRYLGFNLRERPLSDPSFRQAIAYLIDKDFIIKHILHEHGVRADSVVPPDNRLYYNSETPSYGRGLDRDERTRKAFLILNAAGYYWDTPPIDGKGAARKGKGLTTPDGKVVPPLTLLTPPPDYDTERAATGKIIQAWLQHFGIPVVWKSMAFNGLIRMVRNLRDFDMYILGWRNLSYDPDYLRRFFHSTYDNPGEWNDTGYRNTKFDRMADLQAMTMDIQARKQIVFALQSQLMKDLPVIPLYIPHRMEAVRTDRFTGWTTAEGGYGGVRSFSSLKPTEMWSEPHPLHE